MLFLPSGVNEVILIDVLLHGNCIRGPGRITASEENTAKILGRFLRRQPSLRKSKALSHVPGQTARTG